MSDIAILIPCLLTGGTEVATLETASAFQSLGYSVDVLVYFDEVDDTMFETFKAAGLNVRLINARRGGGFRNQWQLAIGLIDVFRGGRFNVIWLQYMTPTLLPMGLARFFSSNLIAAIHVASSHYSLNGLNRIRWLARYACKRIVCVSRTVADGIFAGRDNDLRQTGRVVVIHNALDMGIMQAADVTDWRAQKGWPLDAVVIGFAGRLAHIKGVDVLLQSVAKLHASGLPIRLAIVGDGYERFGLERMAQQLDISHITYFAGRLPREIVFSAIKGFDIAAMPSRGGLEGFGLSALEAMAAGVPVVATRVDALQEVVQDGITGLLCHVDDPTSLADTMAKLVADKALRMRIGAAGIAHAKQHYDTSTYRANISSLLTGLGLRAGSSV